MNEVHAACACLFPGKVIGDDRFWQRLDLQSVKRAYRARALRCHPDRLKAGKQRSLLPKQDEFVRIHESYRVLCAFLKNDREPQPWLPTKKIIAVGGSKGGVGKSILAANLGVLLATLGKRVVLVDLDLDGANLHLYMNRVKPERTLDEFLLGRTRRLEDVAVSTPYGPRLIAGNGRRLGVRQVTFSQKIRIIKELSEIKADYVILDLGGNTSFNTLDFFNAADYGIVVSTCDPAAYLEAIGFTCAAFYRYMLRVFANDSPWRLRKQADLESCIHTIFNEGQGGTYRPMRQLVQHLKKEQPHNLQLLRDIVGRYSLNLVINAATGAEAAREIADHVTRAARKFLFAHMNYLGNLTYSATIAASARNFIPAVRTEPTGPMARAIKRMLSRLDD